MDYRSLELEAAAYRGILRTVATAVKNDKPQIASEIETLLSNTSAGKQLLDAYDRMHNPVQMA